MCVYVLFSFNQSVHQSVSVLIQIDSITFHSNRKSDHPSDIMTNLSRFGTTWTLGRVLTTIPSKVGMKSEQVQVYFPSAFVICNFLFVGSIQLDPENITLHKFGWLLWQQFGHRLSFIWVFDDNMDTAWMFVLTTICSAFEQYHRIHLEIASMVVEQQFGHHLDG